MSLGVVDVSDAVKLVHGKAFLPFRPLPDHPTAGPCAEPPSVRGPGLIKDVSYAARIRAPHRARPIE